LRRNVGAFPHGAPSGDMPIARRICLIYCSSVLATVTPMRKRTAGYLLFVALFCTSNVHATAFAMDERDAVGGDFDNLLPYVFQVEPMYNGPYLSGSFGTPGDASDTILIGVAQGLILTDLYFGFAADSAANPVAVNQGTQLTFKPANGGAALVAIDLSSAQPTGQSYHLAGLNIGAGNYEFMIQTSALLRTDGTPVPYNLSFITLAVPEPEQGALALVGLLGLGLWRRSRQAGHGH
jgi:MYXO-CTERM domain-containing protein